MNLVGLYYCLYFTVCFYSTVKSFSLGGKTTTVKPFPSHQMGTNLLSDREDKGLAIVKAACTGFEARRENTAMKMFLRNDSQLQSTTISEIIGTHNVEVTPSTSKIRVKRQSGAGKFVEAAEMPQIKLVRLFLQMFKNTWDDAYIGGSHPFHPNVPKAIMELYKQKIVEFFIPDIEESKGN